MKSLMKGKRMWIIFLPLLVSEWFCARCLKEIIFDRC